MSSSPHDSKEFLARLRSENASLRARLGPRPEALPAVMVARPESARRGLFDTLRERLAEDDIIGALKLLNASTPHRFTAIYRFDGDLLVNLHVVDREDLHATLFPDLPITASYCIYLRDPLRFFALEDSMVDERVREHPKRDQVRSYCGVALLNDDGSIFGSLCHFDFKALIVSPGAFDLLEEFARVLQHDVRRALSTKPPPP